jgi:hypothetical protein
MTMAPSLKTAALPSRAMPLLVAVTVLLAAAGALLTVRGAPVTAAPAGTATDLSSPLRLGQTATLSTGSTVAVTGIQDPSGPTAADMSGMNHGIQGLVAANQKMVNLTLRFTAPAGKHAVTYSPANVTLDLGRGRAPLHPVSGSLAAGQVTPGGSVEGSLGFVVPRDGSRLLLSIAMGRSSTVRYDLGTVDVAPAGTDTHQH